MLEHIARLNLLVALAWSLELFLESIPTSWNLFIDAGLIINYMIDLLNCA